MLTKLYYEIAHTQRRITKLALVAGGLTAAAVAGYIILNRRPMWFSATILLGLPFGLICLIVWLKTKE